MAQLYDVLAVVVGASGQVGRLPLVFDMTIPRRFHFLFSRRYISPSGNSRLGGPTRERFPDRRNASGHGTSNAGSYRLHSCSRSSAFADSPWRSIEQISSHRMLRLLAHRQGADRRSADA